MSTEPTNDEPRQPLPHIDKAETLSSSSSEADNFFEVSEDTASEEQVDFRWSEQHYRIYKLVQEFSEQTTPNF